MFHTISFRIVLGYHYSLALIKKIQLGKTSFKPKYYNGEFVQYSATYKNVRFNFNPKKHRWHIIIEGETEKILNKSRVTVQDLDIFEETLQKIVEEFFNMNFPIKISKYPLFRIDYKYDVCLKNEREIEIFYEIISKTKNKYNNLKKIRPNEEDKTSMYYRPEGKLNKQGKQHYKRGNFNINVYYRYAYTKNENDKYTIRLEVQVFSKKINSEYKKYRITKELCNYWSLDSYNEYMQVLEKVLYTQDYFRIDIALNKIKNLEKMRPSTKKRICRLLILINEYGETLARRKFSKEYSQSAFYRDMAKLKELGINPITFGNMMDINIEDIEYLKNFLKKEKSVSMS